MWYIYIYIYNNSYGYIHIYIYVCVCVCVHLYLYTFIFRIISNYYGFTLLLDIYILYTFYNHSLFTYYSQEQHRAPRPFVCPQGRAKRRSPPWRPANLSIYLSIRLSIYLSTFLSIYLSTYLSTYLSIHPSISIHPSRSIHLSSPSGVALRVRPQFYHAKIPGLTSKIIKKRQKHTSSTPPGWRLKFRHIFYRTYKNELACRTSGSLECLGCGNTWQYIFSAFWKFNGVCKKHVAESGATVLG